MGCCESVPTESRYDHYDQNSSLNGNKNGGAARRQSSATQNTRPPPRIESCEESITYEVGGAVFQYAFFSQRGFYPDEQNKLNQDAFCVVHNFSGVNGDSLFAVYDGHGRDGYNCAQFAKENLPAQMAKNIRLKRAEYAPRNEDGGYGSKLPVEAYEEACSLAHIASNEAMHKSNRVDDSLSGTTAISIAFHDNTKFTVCNVGDSRAIVGQEVISGDSKSRSYRASPLSRDQTPYRKDERLRVRNCGARILSLDQMEGLEPISDDWGDVNLGEEIDEGGDPPRVWAPAGEFPGTAFTRSLGDMVAEELGVFAEPEIYSRDIMKNDKIIVIASDGVFEFLTNQSVIDMCAKFQDPLEACQAVVAEAYELWLQYECRTDDITMICMFVDAAGVPTSSSPIEATTNGWRPEIERTLSEGSRPVRTFMSKEKEKNIKKQQSMRTFPEDSDIDISTLITEKTDEEKESIAEAIKASVIFRDITDRQRELIFGVMEPVDVKKGDWIIKQHEQGDRFYVVDSGNFEVRILSDGDEDPEGLGGNLVHVYDGASGAHPSFGELALMYSSPRAASIIAQTNGKLWALHRVVFKKILDEKSDKQEVAKILRKILARKGLRTSVTSTIAGLMKEISYDENNVIVRQRDEAEGLYIILKGNCEQAVSFGDNTDYSTLSSGDFFGDKILHSEGGAYDQTVRCISKVRCMVLYRRDLLPHLNSLVSNQMSSKVSVSELKRYGDVHRDELGVTILAKEGRNVYTLKVLAKSSVIDHGDEQRIMEEVKLLQMITKSICIPVVKETFQDRNFLYVLFEEAVACNLDSIIQDPRVTLDEGMAKHVVMCCLDALEIIHSKGVIYNGISSESLLVSHDGYILLNNFRFSKESSDSSAMSTYVFGSVKYRSPEIVENQGFGIASDFWALGVLIYECITRETPFASYGQYDEDIYERIVRHQFNSINLHSGMSREGHAIVNKLLNPDPLDRLGGAGARSVKKDIWFSGLAALGKHKELSANAKRHLKTALASRDATTKLPFNGNADDPMFWKHFQYS